MIKKRETCLYCGEKMESITAKKKFCCVKHKVYWNREFRPKKRSVIKKQNSHKSTKVLSEIQSLMNK